MDTTHLAAPELEAVEVTGSTRGAFLLRGALATGALLGGSAVSPFVGRALAQETGGDADILNFALTLEYLEAAFYDRAVGKGRGMSSETRRLARELRDNETAHVDALKETIKRLGAKPVKAPTVGFGDVFTSERTFLKLAQTLEDTGVSAYNGAAPQIKSTEVLGAAGSIVQVEARHAALIRLMRGQDPAPDAFDPSLDKQQVLDAVMPFVRS
jgi:serine-rich repeat adhesion-like glycoprotein